METPYLLLLQMLLYAMTEMESGENRRGRHGWLIKVGEWATSLAARGASASSVRHKTAPTQYHRSNFRAHVIFAYS